MLYVVATPIGNLKDITLRALETLKAVDIILCEDTRVTKNFLDHYEINKQLVSYHLFSDFKKMKEIAGWLDEGKNIALVTDAGTPGISDPGSMLIEYILKSKPDTKIESIPGASAVAAALSVSGFPADKFYFGGFPPHKNKRQKYFNELSKRDELVVFYESPHRITKCLEELKKYFAPDRPVMIARELTKKFETLYRGTIKDLESMQIPEKGEFVIVINAK